MFHPWRNVHYEVFIRKFKYQKKKDGNKDIFNSFSFVDANVWNFNFYRRFCIWIYFYIIDVSVFMDWCQRDKSNIQVKQILKITQKSQ